MQPRPRKNDTPAVIVNPSSRGGRTGRHWRRLAKRIAAAVGPFCTYSTNAPRHAAELAAQALDDGYRWLVAVGGDGTVNEVVNGCLDPATDRARIPGTAISVVMRGTGNDLRRTLTGARSLGGDLRAIRDGQPQPWDIGKVTYVDNAGRRRQRYFANLASFGISGAIDRRVNHARWSRYAGAKATFLSAALKTLRTYRNPSVNLTVDGRRHDAGPVFLACIANGRYAGGGMQFAPTADPGDGRFDLVVMADIKRGQAVRALPRLYRGTHINEMHVWSKRCTRIEADSDALVLLDIDGEAPGRLPATFELLPHALTFIG